MNIGGTRIEKKKLISKQRTPTLKMKEGNKNELSLKESKDKIGGNILTLIIRLVCSYYDLLFFFDHLLNNTFNPFKNFIFQ